MFACSSCLQFAYFRSLPQKKFLFELICKQMSSFYKCLSFCQHGGLFSLVSLNNPLPHFICYVLTQSSCPTLRAKTKLNRIQQLQLPIYISGLHLSYSMPAFGIESILTFFLHKILFPFSLPFLFHDASSIEIMNLT